MGQILIVSLGAAVAVLLACACCKAVWVAGNAKGFESGYAEGRKARAQANARRRGARNLKEKRQLKTE